MKHLLRIAVLLALVGAAAQQFALAEESKTLQSTEQQKVVRDPKEFLAYKNAERIKDPTERGKAMEEFADRYPHSVVYGDALQQAMAAYQAAGDGAKVERAALRLLKYDPKNIQALAIITFIKMNANTEAGAKEAKDYAEQGLKLLPGWKGERGISKAEFESQRREVTAVFYNAVGLAALYAKDYPAARAALLKAIALSGANFIYPYRLAIADLEGAPLEPRGFWYIAKSIALARTQNPPAARQIEPYGAAKYKKYHGSMDGWDAILASAAKEKAPPRGFTVAAAPSAK